MTRERFNGALLVYTGGNMTYKAGRAKKLCDTIELTDESGNTVKRLEIQLDIDMTAHDITSRYDNFLTLSRQLKDAQRANNRDEFYRLVSLYTLAMDQLFSIAFGDKNKAEIYEFYEDNYLEMAEKLMLYIFARIIPAAADSVKRKKNDLKRAFKQKL